MKYTDEIKNEENEVHHMLLEEIEPEATVLEFGAAGGRFTKILKEDYNCKVYIVEYEKEAFDLAMQYAVEGICEDLELYSWKKWNNIEFDYIFFTDVLEHLRFPKQALINTVPLLKDNGRVLISLPSVAHNDIFVKLYYNKFEYTDIGLLDDTHLHLYSEKSLDDLIHDTGYEIETVRHKTVKTGSTEQCAKEKLRLDSRLRKLLLERPNGEVYQNVISLKKKGCIKSKYIEPESFTRLEGWLYIDIGNGFDQENAKMVYADRMSEDVYRYKIDIEPESNWKRIRLDPIEEEYCEVIDLRTNMGEPVISDFVDGRVIASTDPGIIWKINDKIQLIQIDLTVGINEIKNQNLIRDYIFRLRGENETLNLKIGLYIFENYKKENYIEELKNKYLIIESELGLYKAENEKKENYISELQQQISKVISELELYKAENTKKEAYIEELIKDNGNKDNEIGLYKAENEKKERYILELQDRIRHPFFRNKKI